MTTPFKFCSRSSHKHDSSKEPAPPSVTVDDIYDRPKVPAVPYVPPPPSSSGLATNSNFLCFLFVKNHQMPSRQINDPSSGKHYSLLFLPTIPSSPSRTLKGIFELTKIPSRALNSPHASLPELQRYTRTLSGVPH